MDKKIILVIVAIFVIALGGVACWFFVQNIKIPKVEEIKELLPADALMFVEVKDIKQTLDKVKNTELYYLMGELKQRVQERSGTPVPKNQFLNERIKNFLESEIINAFGRSGVVAFYPTEFEGIEENGPQILFVTRLEPKMKIEKSLLETFLRTEELKAVKDRISKESYQGLNFNIINLEKDTEVVYLVLRDVLVLSNSPEIVRNVIDVLKKDRPSLWQDTCFVSAYGRKSKIATIFAYIDLKIFKDVLFYVMKQKQDNESLRDLEDFSDMFQAYGFPEFDYGTFELDVYDGLHIGYSMVFDTSTLNKELRKFWSATRLEDMNMINLIPRDTILLSFTASQENSKEYYRYTAEAINRLKSEELRQRSLQQRQQIEDYFHKLGFEYEDDILPLIKEKGFVFLGLEQVSLMSNTPPIQGPRIQAPSITFPFPRFCFIMKVSDRRKAEEIISQAMESLIDEIKQKIKQKNESAGAVNAPEARGNAYNPVLPQEPKLEEAMISIQEEVYNGIKITRLFNLIPLFPFLSPGYCFVDNYLVVSLNDIALRDIIDTYQERRSSFGSNIDFIKFSASLPKEITGLFYTDTEHLAKELLQLKNTVKLIPRLSNSVEIQEAIDIITDILRELSTIEGYIVFDEEYFRGDIFVKIKGL